VEELKERLRKRIPKDVPGLSVTFEAGDVVSKVMSFGSATPIEVAITGPSLTADRAFAQALQARLEKLSSVNELQIVQPIDYPALNVKVDRRRAGQYGLTMEQVGKALTAATSSTRYTHPTYWRDPKSGVAYQVQVELPQSSMTSIEDVQAVPATVLND